MSDYTVKPNALVLKAHIGSECEPEKTPNNEEPDRATTVSLRERYALTLAVVTKVGAFHAGAEALVVNMSEERRDSANALEVMGSYSNTTENARHCCDRTVVPNTACKGSPGEPSYVIRGHEYDPCDAKPNDGKYHIH